MSRGAVAEPDLRFHGSYQSGRSENSTYLHLRFYSDGSVIGITSTGTAEEICDWFRRDRQGYLGHGTYTRADEKIEFALVYDEFEDRRVTVIHSGTVGSDMLTLETVSDYDGHRAIRRYDFHACSEPTISDDRLIR